jgi:hypothetical protein
MNTFFNASLLSSPLSIFVSFYSIELLSADVYEGYVYVTGNPNSVTSAFNRKSVKSLSPVDKTNVPWRELEVTAATDKILNCSFKT